MKNKDKKNTNLWSNINWNESKNENHKIIRYKLKARKQFITCDNLVIGRFNDNVINWLLCKIFPYWMNCMLDTAVGELPLFWSSFADVTLFHTCVLDNCPGLQLLAA